jgi:ADP-ribosylglycohydrolase
MATKSAEVTHNHEEGIKGAVVTATCIRMAKDGASKEDILQYAISKYSSKARNYPYRFGCDRAYKDYFDETKMDETCMTSVPIAIRCFYESSSFEDCMRKINSLCCDTDTIGAIAGAICESYYGSCLGSKEKDMAMILRYLPSELYAEVARYKGFAEDGSDVKHLNNVMEEKSTILEEKPKKKWYEFWKK